MATARTNVVDRYFDGFRRSDHELILGCLTDDVAWDLPGFRHLAGKEAFDREIENEEFVGSPALTVDRSSRRTTSWSQPARGRPPTGAARSTASRSATSSPSRGTRSAGWSPTWPPSPDGPA